VGEKEKRKSESAGEAVETALDGAVENVVAHADAEAAEKGGVGLILDGEVVAILRDKPVGDALAAGGIQLGRAFDEHPAAFQLEARQPVQGDQDRAVVARLLFDQLGDHPAELRFIKPAAGLAEPENAAGGGGGDLGDLHGLEVAAEMRIKPR